MLRKNVAAQVVTFNAVNATTGAALTGATVTTKVTLDGTQSASAGTLTELGTGQYKYVPTQGETNGASVGISFTATNMVPVNLQCFTIGQDPTAVTFDTNVTKLLGTAWLTPGTAGTPDINVKLWNGLTTVALPLIPTVAGRTLDCSAGGEAGLDWANVGSPTTAVDLSSTTIKTTQKVDVDTIKTNPVVNAGTITFPTTATLASTTNITAGTIATVSGNVNGSVGSVTGAVGSVTGAVGSVTAAISLSAGDSQIVQSGTAAAGGASTITIQTALGADSLPVGCKLKITSGTGIGQCRTIITYVNATKVTTVDRAWTTAPDNTSVYTIFWDDAPAISSGLKITGLVLADTLTTYTGNTVQTGDTYARLGAPAGASHAADVAAVKVDTAAVKVQTDKLVFTVANQLDVNVLDWKSSTAPAMTGDAYARLGAPAGASVSADVAAVKSDSGAVKTQTDKLTFTVANQLDSNVLDWKSSTAPAMTGDAYARLGAPAGASVSADVAAIKSDTGSILSAVDTEVAAILAAVDTEVASILSLLNDARGEPAQGNPPVNPNLATKIDYIYKSWRNKKDNDGSVTQLYADGGVTVDHKQATASAAGVVSKAKWVTGP